jgi:pimeloyl-ACP methyl ester carboxylesterase
MPSIPINGTSLYYEMHGSGIPLVFIHGHLASHHVFTPQIEYFGKRMKVIAIDLRGSGQSGKMDVEIGHIVDTQCEDLRILLDQLGQEKVVLVGGATGGVIAQKYALLHPNQVQALVLVDGCLCNPLSNRLGKLWEASEIIRGLVAYLPAEFFLRFLRITYNRWLPAYKILRHELLHKRPTESIKQFLAMRKAGVLVDCTQLDLPVLFVEGSQNEWYLKQMASWLSCLPCAEVVVMDDALYPSQLCQPQVFNRLLLNFLIDQQLVS